MMEDAQTNGETFAAIERQVLELATQAVVAAQEHADAEAALAAAQERVAAITERLPQVEALAKKRRQARHDAVRDRAEIERRLSSLLEEENSARARRRQAEQLAAGFRSAEAFASMAGNEAQAGGDGDRVVRENAVALRARREAEQAEARVAELRAAEDKISAERAEVEGHVMAERDFERKLSEERDETESEAASLRAELLAAQHALEEYGERLERLELEAKRVVAERSQALERLKEGRRRARVELEERVARLREEERDAVARRTEAERLLGAFMQAENRANAEIAVHEREAAKRIATERAERAEAERLESERESAERAAPETEEADAAAAAQASAPAEAPAERLTPSEPGVAAASVTPSPAAAPARAAIPPANGSPLDDSPLLRSLIGLFARKPRVAPPEPVLDGPSIADRIARDFGALGREVRDEPAAPAAPTNGSVPPPREAGA